MRKKDNAAGLYIHVPFCHARCGYCDFVTFTGKEAQIGLYAEALCHEIAMVPSASIATVFLGGGTPSLLDARPLSRVFQTLRRHFDLHTDAEITLEANPESVTFEKARAWRSAGINRLSLGLQSFDDKLLKTMGRLHTAQQFRDAYRAVRRAGFANVNIDLIYGFAGQTLESWQDTLENAIALEPEHLSLYALTIEEHTPFGAAGMRVDEDLQADMYTWARSVLDVHGYEQYEISNFARRGRACRHNLIYWRQQDYWGLGVGAVGCVDGVRWENHKNLPDYFRDIKEGRLPRAAVENLEPSARKFERLMLGLRLREGLSWDNEENTEWLRRRDDLAQRGYLEEIRPGRWRIPEHAVALTNQILLPFVK